MSLLLENFIPVVKWHGLNTEKPAKFAGGIQIGADSAVGITTISSSEVTTVSNSAAVTVGTEGRDAAGNIYVYLEGVADVVAGDWGTFSADFKFTRGATNSAAAPVAIAMAATVAGKFGWFQVYGKGSAKAVATGGVRVYSHTVTGQLLSTVVTGALVHGMFTVPGTGNTVTGTLTDVRLVYPYVDRASGSY